MFKGSLRAAGSNVVTSKNGSQVTLSTKKQKVEDDAPEAAPKLSKFQKIKLRVMASRRYKGRALDVPNEVVEKFQRDSGSAEMQKKLAAYLGLDYVPMKQAEKMKAQRERFADGEITEDELAELMRNPYDLKSSAKLKRILFVPKDAETGEKLKISEQIAPARHTDNMIFRKEVLSNIRESLQHAERPNRFVFKDALAKYNEDPHHQLPQPRSIAGKREKRGQMAASLQQLRQEHAKQVYELIQEEEERDAHRAKLMSWAQKEGDVAKIKKMNRRFDRERLRWRDFIATVQEDNQMHLANKMAYYGFIR